MKTNHPKRRPAARVRGHPGPGLRHPRRPSCDDAIEGVQQRLASLQRQAAKSPEASEHILSQTFTELQITLEELRVADEELRQQNEELILARQTTVERHGCPA